MTLRGRLGRVSPRMHLAMGLASLAVGVVLLATYLGLVPETEPLVRQHRGALGIGEVAQGAATDLAGMLECG